MQRKVFLHGSGRTSWVFLSRSEVPQDSFEQQGAISPPKGSSDELRVYDVEDGELELRFRLQPQLRLRRDDGHSVPLGPAFEISLGPIRDRNHDGRPEIVGTIDRSLFDRRPRPEEGRVPFAVLWDDAQGRYRLRALVPKPPDLKRIRDREHYLPGWVSHLELWSHPVLVSDAHGSLEKPVRAYSVSNSLVPEQAAALLASFEVPPLRFRTDAGVVTQTRFEVKGWWLEIQGADVDPSPLVFCVHNPHYITTCRTSIESRSECGRTEGANRSPRQALDCPRRCGKAAQYLPRQCELNSRR